MATSRALFHFALRGTALFASARASARPLASLAALPSAAWLPSALAAPRASAVASLPSSAPSAAASLSAGVCGGGLFSAQRRHMTIKTKSAVKKRFRVTGGGLLVRFKAGRRHLNVHKSRSRVNRLGA